jgi:hypothetical protein
MYQAHGTRTSFDATTPSYDFGFRYVQGSTNGPGTGGAQFYSWYIGLGSEYPATGAGSYGAMFAVDRNVATPYLSVRYNESNSFTTWRKVAAGYADSAGAVDFNNLTNKASGSGTYTTSGDFRAPLFYDSNNTGFYLDPAGGSNLSSVQIAYLGVGTAASGTTGEILATNNITAYYSDERLKTRFENIPNALEKVMSLSGFYYEPNEIAQSLGYEKKREIGVSAQEVEAVFPEIVAPAPIDDKYMTVRYEKLVAVLIEAVKEQQSNINKLEQRISILEGK